MFMKKEQQEQLFNSRERNEIWKLEVHPISAGTSKEFDIIGPRVFCKIDTNISFKKDGQAKCDLTF